MMQPEIYCQYRLRLTTCISKCAAGWQPVGHDDIGKSHLRWCLPCTTFKISAYESAGAVKHPVQTWSQVLLYLESMQERRKGQRKIYDGEARPWFEPLTLSLILNEVEGYRAQLCAGPVYIRRITVEADGSNAIYWWSWMNAPHCVCDSFLWLSLRWSILC